MYKIIYTYDLTKIKKSIRLYFVNMNALNALEQAIKKENILKKHNLDKIGIFGSFARGETANDVENILRKFVWTIYRIRKNKTEIIFTRIKNSD